MLNLDAFDGLEAFLSDPEYREPLNLPEKRTEEYTLLAQGENNVNFLFDHPKTGQRLLLRVNTDTQLHIDDQIGYEANALKLLEGTGRTPRLLNVWAGTAQRPNGVLVEEWLPGHPLDYRTELNLGAEALADIHAVVPAAGSGIFVPEDPLKAILDECEEMFSVYTNAESRDRRTEAHIRSLLDQAWNLWKQAAAAGDYRCLINTELNNYNFLINGPGKQNYVIDWEKPLISEPAQDLGHFLAPTTTFWRTDLFLKRKEVENVLHHYTNAVAGRFPIEDIIPRTMEYLSITCLRGITYCAMALIHYESSDRVVQNTSTRKKLGQYLEEEFLTFIEESYLRKR